MFSRETPMRARLPRSHFFVTVARGEGMRTFALRPYAIWAIAALLPLAILWAGVATAYIAFHDDMLAAYIVREARMQNAYEDRIADARGELDRVAARQLLDQGSFEGRMHDLLSRQARLEQHDKIIETLANQISGREPSANMAAHPVAKPKPTDAPQRPTAPDAAKPVSGEGDPESLSDVRSPGAQDSHAADLAAAAGDRGLDAGARLGLVSFSIDRVERSQIAMFAGIAQKAHTDAGRLSAVVARTGLSNDQLSPPDAKGGVGGPFLPVDPSPGAPAFDKAFASAAREVARDYRLRRLMVYMPVREPLAGDLNVSSPFGYRTDPFLGKPALHPGVDLVQAPGADIKATAAGKVVHAGWMGGYGQMVEIDHGNGLATRYGHMSQVDVDEGDEVKAGEVIGHVGSTGRSTGPHLHYEVRVDGEPVDPERFLDAAEVFSQAAAL